MAELVTGQSMGVTYVPNPAKADGELGTGSNATPITAQDVDVKYVPEPGAADDV